MTNPGFLVKTSLALGFFLILSFFPFASAGADRASFIPWSGYWWPYTRGGLGTGLDYRGYPAPLEKYNLLTTGVAAGDVLQRYLNAYYDPYAPSWYGLCLHWALAACCEHMDILPSSVDNIVFRVGDKKGLLTLAHDRDIVETGGGWLPEEFHWWLLHYIGDQKKAFVADLWAGEAVWSYPIYEYTMQTSRTGSEETVSVTVYYADDDVAPDYIGTKVQKSDYTYKLFLDATGAITGGEWTGNSVADHPEILSFSSGVGTVFPGLDYQEILGLARSRDDFLEEGIRSVEITPGTYHLILLDEDAYRISAKPGDSLSLRIEKEPGSSQNIEAVVTDGNGDEVRRAIIEDGIPLNELFPAAMPPYTIRLTQDDSTYTTEPNIYTLRVDLEKSFSQQVPYIPKTNVYSGFALTNPGTVAVGGVTLIARDEDGAPIRTVLGPLRLQPGEKRIFFFSDFPMPLHEMAATEGLVLTADGPVDLLNLIGGEDRFLATLVQGDARGSRLVIPDTAALMTPGVTMFGGVRNESFEDARVALRLYSADGLLQKTAQETIAARGHLFLKPGYHPFYKMPQSGWIEIRGDGEQMLNGFQYTSNASGVETLFALPVSAGRKILPLVGDRGYWITRLTLINPNDTQNHVKLHLALAGPDASGGLDIVLAPREKRVLEIQDLFGLMPGDPLYHSILEIISDDPFAGYYTYSIPDGNDYASYPLLEGGSFKETLSLPHYPGNDGYWCTGVVVCNPSTDPVTVRIEPYDHDGKLMEESVREVYLDGGAHDVFDVASRFGEAESSISFIRFRTEDGAGAIGGFYLYGDRGGHILSGANM